MNNIVVVVPTIREERIQAFLRAWQFPCPVIVVEDNPEPTFQIEGVQHYAWDAIERDLGADSWIIPRRTDCVRSYGYWKAWQTGAEVMVTLDDDCLPCDPPIAAYFLRSHLDNLAPTATPRWQSTLDGLYPRGYPYTGTTIETPVALSHGLWTNVLDYDSLSQLHYSREPHGEVTPIRGPVARGQYFPMCGMNLAWRREYTPLLYFLLMGTAADGTPWPFDRFGDIWCGVIAKKILDHLGVGVHTGSPLVHHDRASNVWANFDKEHAGIKEHETFWRRIDATPLTGSHLLGCYWQIAAAMAKWPGDYWPTLSRAMYTWSGLYA